MTDGTNFDAVTAMKAAIREWGTLAEYIAPRCRPHSIDAAVRMDEFSVEAWHRLSRYALFELRFTERTRPLTAYEEQMRRIAERVYDATTDRPNAPWPKRQMKETER